jgi:uncharacterized integral membrane protein
MSPTRLSILLLILVGVTLFALQNWSPVLPLVILGTQTQALPLAIWMVGAIAAGVITTLITSALLRLSNFTASPRRSKPKRAGRVASDPRTPWSGSQQSTSQQNASWQNASRQNSNSMDVPFTVTDSPDYVYAASNTAYTASNVTDDDWEQRSSRSEEWDNWEDDQEPVPSPVDRPITQTTAFSGPPTFIQDPSPPTDSSPYAPGLSNDAPGFSNDKEEWEDWEDYQESEDDEFEDAFEEDEFEEDEFEEDEFEEEAATNQTDAEPSRTIYEVQQTPKSSYRSGSIYSYSYRDSGDSSVGKTESVYDADYRVIIPPYQPDAGHRAEAAEVDDFDQEDLDQDLNQENLDQGDLNQGDLGQGDRPKPFGKHQSDEDW